MLLGGWRRRSALVTGGFRTGPSHKPYKGLGELTPGVCGDFGAQRSRRDGPTADLLHCAQTLRLEPHGCSASTDPYRRSIPHLFGIFRLQKLMCSFFAISLPEGRNRHRRGRPRYLEIFELESRRHHGALWWSRRTALAAFGDFFFWASGHGLEAIRGAYSVNPRTSPPPSRADGVIDQYEYITSHLGET